MPRRCSVFGCRSNYDGEQHTTTFSLPNDPLMRATWLNKIPTDFSKLKNPVICSKHFDESLIILKHKVFYKGEYREYDRDRPKLKDDAVPSIFPSCPSYLSNTAVKSKRLVDFETENFDKAIVESINSYATYISEQKLSSVSEIFRYLKTKDLPETCLYYIKNGTLILCIMDDNNECGAVVSSCIVINENLFVKLYIDKIPVSDKKIPVKNSVVCNVNDLDNILEYMKSIVKTSYSRDSLQFALSILKALPEYNETDALKFYVEQLSLLYTDKNGRRYDNQTMVLASCLYIYSPSAYHALSKSGLLILPHPRNLRKLICNFGLSNSSMDGSISYLKGRLKYLKEHELIVTLIMDEIYIQPELTFKGGQIYGRSEIDSSKIAKTVLVFMVSSILSKYKDVVALVPVINLTANHLKQMTDAIINIIEQLGFKIIALVSDNNSVNRKTFELFTENKMLQPSIPHPLDESRTLFFIFDTVHILKCIRNNWGNKTNENRSIKFPCMHNNNILSAQYQHLVTMYEIEKSSLVKYGHTLSTKVLFPSSIQKQNVNLAIKLFNENNIIALKHVAKDHPNLFLGVESTCTFIDIIVSWWKIVNVRSVYEGKRFNDNYREPIRDGSNFQVNFLQKICNWLKIWRQSVQISDALTAQTFQALIITLESFLELIPYLFDNYKIDYILLSKFQSDNLEGRFSSYRQLSGANYYINYVQVLENERKIRFKNTILFSAKHMDIPIRTLIPINEDSDSNVDLEMFCEIVEIPFIFDLIPENILPILTYISGYSARKVIKLQKCLVCISWLQLDKTCDVDSTYDFLKDKDRGKLTLPTEFVIFVAGIVWHTLNSLIACPEFLKVKHLSVLQKIACIKLERSDDIPLYDICFCEQKLIDKLKAVSLILSKIVINNYVKMINDNQRASTSASNSARKIRKLNPKK